MTHKIIIEPPSVKRCAFCPHTRLMHRQRYYGEWCEVCDEICSFLFIPVHPFEKCRTPFHREDCCWVCHLMETNDAHTK